jgi:hypothetical protein
VDNNGNTQHSAARRCATRVVALYFNKERKELKRIPRPCLALPCSGPARLLLMATTMNFSTNRQQQLVLCFVVATLNNNNNNKKKKKQQHTS